MVVGKVDGDFDGVLLGKLVGIAVVGEYDGTVVGYRDGDGVGAPEKLGGNVVGQKPEHANLLALPTRTR